MVTTTRPTPINATAAAYQAIEDLHVATTRLVNESDVTVARLLPLMEALILAREALRGIEGRPSIFQTTAALIDRVAAGDEAHRDYLHGLYEEAGITGPAEVVWDEDERDWVLVSKQRSLDQIIANVCGETDD